MEEKKSIKQKLLPFILCVAVVIIDQVTKLWVVKTIPQNTIYCSFFGDLLRIIHVRNLGAAFSLGHAMPLVARKFVFSLLPLLVIIYISKLVYCDNDFTKVQKWAICGVIGGGIGNLIDRIFRSKGVVDFIDVKFFGIFGLERWPTFNVADAVIVVCGAILIITYIKMLFTKDKE